MSSPQTSLQRYKTFLKNSWHMPEMRLLSALIFMSGLLTCFFVLANEVMDGDTHALDSAILMALRVGQPDNPIGPPWLEFAMRDLTALGGYTVLVLLSACSMFYLLLRKKWVSAGLVVVSGLSGILFNHILKMYFERPRPDVVAHLVDVSSLSFPSGHAMLSAVIYLTLGVLLARSQTAWAIKVYILGVAILLSLLVGLSRIYLGVHWPTDVLAGWCMGAAWAMGCLLLVGWLNRRVSHI